jgi:hypothetical protein
MEEQLWVLKIFKNKETLGPDCLNIQYVTCASHELLTHFIDFANVCWKGGDVPEGWNIVLMIPLYKKGDRSLKITEVYVCLVLDIKCIQR